jgi:CBS domain-containing protein
MPQRTEVDLGTETVEGSMTVGLLRCPPDAGLAEMAATMAGDRVHCLLVDLSGAPGRGSHPDWGVVSDQDLVAAAATGRGAAAQIAGSPAVTVTPDRKLLHAAELMRDYQTSHLVVVGAEGDPVGVLSTLDIAAALAGPA